MNLSVFIIVMLDSPVVTVLYLCSWLSPASYVSYWSCCPFVISVCLRILLLHLLADIMIILPRPRRVLRLLCIMDLLCHHLIYMILICVGMLLKYVIIMPFTSSWVYHYPVGS